MAVENVRLQKETSGTADEQDRAQKEAEESFSLKTAEEEGQAQAMSEEASAREAAENELELEMADADLKKWIDENPLEDYYADKPACSLGDKLAEETACPSEVKAPVGRSGE